MPDVSVKQALTPQIEQTPTKQASLLDAYKPGTKVVPSYLVSLDAGKKSEAYFIAVKFDFADHCGKFVGFYCDETKDIIVSNYDEIIRATDPTSFVEIHFPWIKIQSIRSLVYKHKIVR